MSSIRRGSQSADQDARRATSAMLALTPLGVSTRASPRSARRGATRAKPVAPRRRDPDLVPSRLGDARLVSTRAGPNGFEEVDIDSIGAPGDDPRPPPAPPPPPPPPLPSAPASKPTDAVMRGGKGGGKRQADSTDAVATFLTRRFGIAGGLAWLGILTFGVVSEQLKTRREVREAIENTKEVKNAVERVSPTGVRATDVKTGGGEAPRPGYLIAADVVATVEETGAVVVDTRKRRRQVVFTYGRAQGPISRGVLEAVGEMRQGGRRIVVVPPEMGFGDEGAVLTEGNVPPGATVRYDIELARVSVPPS